MSLPASDDASAPIVKSVLAEVRKALPRAAAPQLTLDSSLADAGLDSLARMHVVNCLEDAFQIRFTEDSLYYLDTCRDLVEYIVAKTEFQASPTSASRATPLRQQSQAVGRDNYALDQFVECQALNERLEATAASGFVNPFFRLKDRVTPDSVTIANQELVSYTSFDYLGLARDTRVIAAAKSAIDRFGTSASASRLVGGNNSIIEELDSALANFLGMEAAIALPSGYGTNASVLGHIVGPDDLILYDELAHNSIVQGAKLSQASLRPFPHNDFEFVDGYLAQHRAEFRRVVIAVEGVYSMDGDYPHLPRLLEVKTQRRAVLYIDEAHSLGALGATGRGIFEYYGLDPRAGDLCMGTISKALGSGGGFIAGSAAFVRYLKYTLPANVFATALSPANAAAALAALNVLQAEPERVTRLARRSDQFLELAQQHGFDTGASGGTPIIPIMVRDSQRCLALSEALRQRGIDVQPILYPAVPESQSRLRFFITADHTERQIADAVAVLAECLSDSTVSVS